MQIDDKSDELHKMWAYRTTPGSTVHFLVHCRGTTYLALYRHHGVRYRRHGLLRSLLLCRSKYDKSAITYSTIIYCCTAYSLLYFIVVLLVSDDVLKFDLSAPLENIDTCKFSGERSLWSFEHMCIQYYFETKINR